MAFLLTAEAPDILALALVRIAAFLVLICVFILVLL
jgi:hypothetical protein